MIRRKEKEKENEIQMLGCPLCNTEAKGNTEHMHLYCGNNHIKETRMMMNEVVTAALEDHYQIAEMYKRSEEGQERKFQGNLERAVREAELERHQIISSRIVEMKEVKEIIRVRRESNKASKTEEEMKEELKKGIISQEESSRSSEFKLLH